MEEKSTGFTVLRSHAGDSCWLYLTLYNLARPPIMTRCSIVAVFEGVRHFASKSPKADVHLRIIVKRKEGTFTSGERESW